MDSTHNVVYISYIYTHVSKNKRPDHAHSASSKRMQSLDTAYLAPGRETAEQDEEEEEVGQYEDKDSEEEPFSLTCPNSGCKFSIADESQEKRMTDHKKHCEFQVSVI